MQCFLQCCGSASRWCGSGSLFYYNADLGPTFHFLADTDPKFTLMRIRILITVIRILWPVVCRLFSAPFWASTPPLLASTTLHGSIFRPTTPEFDSDADPDIAFDFYADLAFYSDADHCGSGPQHWFLCYILLDRYRYDNGTYPVVFLGHCAEFTSTNIGAAVVSFFKYYKYIY